MGYMIGSAASKACTAESYSSRKREAHTNNQVSQSGSMHIQRLFRDIGEEYRLQKQGTEAKRVR